MLAYLFSGSDTATVGVTLASIGGLDTSLVINARRASQWARKGNGAARWLNRPSWIAIRVSAVTLVLKFVLVEQNLSDLVENKTVQNI